MTTYASETFSGGTNGATITTGNTSGDLVVGSPKFSAPGLFGASLCMAVSVGTAAQQYWETAYSTAEAAGFHCFSVDASGGWPTSVWFPANLIASGVEQAQIRINAPSAGVVTVSLRNSSTAVYTSVATLAAGVYTFEHGWDSAGGHQTLTVWDNTGTSVISSGNQTYSGAAIAKSQIGNCTSVANVSANFGRVIDGSTSAGAPSTTVTVTGAAATVTAVANPGSVSGAPFGGNWFGWGFDAGLNIPGPPPPPPPPSTTAFGVCILDNVQGYPVAQTTYGQLLTTYTTGTGPTKNFGSDWNSAYNVFSRLVTAGYGTNPNERMPILCAVSHNTAQYNTLQTNMHSIWDKPYITVHLQEWETKITGTTTYATMHADYADMGTQRDAHPNGKTENLIALANRGYKEIDAPTSGFLLANMMSGFPKGVLNIMGWDIYQPDFVTPVCPTPSVWPAATYLNYGTQSSITYASYGVGGVLPWLCMEFGLQKSQKSGDTDSDTKMAARAQAAVNYAINDPSCLGINYWQNKVSPGPGALAYGIIGTDPFNGAVPQTLKVWQDAVAS